MSAYTRLRAARARRVRNVQLQRALQRALRDAR